MKRTLANLMLQAGAFAPFRLANRSRTLILTYHRFSRDEEPDKISSSSLERHLEYLQANYRLASLAAVSEALGRGLVPPPGTAVITIDDGYSDSYEVAFPILRKHGVPATLFVVTGFVDRKTWMWTDKMRYLTFRLPEGRMTIEIDGRETRFTIDDFASRLRAADSVNGSLKMLPNDLKERTIERLAAEFGLSLPEAPPEDFSPVTWEQAREMDAQGVEIGSHTLTHPILTNIGDMQLGREMRDSKSRLEEILDREVPHF